MSTYSKAIGQTIEEIDAPIAINDETSLGIANATSYIRMVLQGMYLTSITGFTSATLLIKAYDPTTGQQRITASLTITALGTDGGNWNYFRTTKGNLSGFGRCEGAITPDATVTLMSIPPFKVFPKEQVTLTITGSTLAGGRAVAQKLIYQSS